MTNSTFNLNDPAMTPEERQFFSQDHRFQGYSGFDGDTTRTHNEEDQSGDDTDSYRMDKGGRYWEWSRGEKLRSLSTSKKCERNCLRILQENNPSHRRVAELTELLRLYDVLRNMVVQEAVPGWDWRSGLWDQIIVWKKIKPLRYMRDSDDDN